jgi:hypothetical protein
MPAGFVIYDADGAQLPVCFPLKIIQSLQRTTIHGGRSMDTIVQVTRTTQSSMESSEVATSIDELFNNVDAVRRSEENILQWMKYLPEDCINRMIHMGWDVTT